MEYLRYGEDGIRVVFGDKIDPVINENIRRYYLFLKSLETAEIIDIIPSFFTCLIRFKCESISFEKLVKHLSERESSISVFDAPEPIVHEIPVAYGGVNGPDMGFVTSHAKLSEDEIIRLHTSTVYNVYAVGFIPGFPYLGILDKKLYVPRLETPRLKVPKGSVGLAQFQTGIYTHESPGGWQIIGKTEAELFDHTKKPFSKIGVGDKVRFVRA